MKQIQSELNSISKLLISKETEFKEMMSDIKEMSKAGVEIRKNNSYFLDSIQKLRKKIGKFEDDNLIYDVEELGEILEDLKMTVAKADKAWDKLYKRYF